MVVIRVLPRRTDFNDLLIGSVEEAISEVLDFRVISEFWYHYQTFLGITRDETPYRLNTLYTSLKDLFGVGGGILEPLIVKKLYAKANIPLSYSRYRSLSEYVEELKQIQFENLT